MFKPFGANLKTYHPDNVCLRLRTIVDQPSTLVELRTIKTNTGYSDEKKLFGQGSPEGLKQKARELGYEPWGEMTVNSTEYKLNINNNLITVLFQKITPIGEFLKIESPSVDALNQILKILTVSDTEKIARNSAVLLAEKMGLIK